MDLFAIICTTCKSRLRVREEGAIGQILACPKCGGMVMVKPPPNWSAGSQAKQDEPTITDVVAPAAKVDLTSRAAAFEDVEDLLSDAPPRTYTPPPAAAHVVTAAPVATPTASAPPATKPRFVGGPPTAAPAPAKPRPQPAMTNGDAAALAPPPPAESASPTPAASPPQGRYWALMAGSVAAGIVLVFAAVSGAMYFLRDDPATVAQVTPAGTAGKTGTDSPQAVPGTPESPKVPANSDTAPAVTTPNDATPAVTPPAVAPAPENPAAPAPPMPGTTEPIVIVQPPVAPAVPPGLQDPLAKFDKLIGGADQPEEGAATTVAPAAAPAVKPPPEPARAALPRPPPRDVDLARRLADPLLGIDTTGTPLADFLDRFSDLTNIPITLEPDALLIFQRTAETPIVLSAKNTTVGGALTQALAALNMEFVAADGQLIVRIAEPAALRSLDYPIKDLVAAEEEEMLALAELLKALVEPASWGDAPEQGAIEVNVAKKSLSIRQRWAVHAPLLVLCEKLRVARGKPPVTTRFSPALFKLDSRSALAQAKLQTPITLNFSQPTRLTAVLDRLSEAAGMRILVDWRDVAGAGWNPDADATLVASKQPLGDALNALLSPMELSWRVIDGRTLQVVTPARLDERQEIELYPAAGLLADDDSGEALQAKIRDALGASSFRDGGGSGELRLDPVGKCLLAALPQPKQRELESLLTRWRGEASSQ